ncbi:MAG: 1-(5-phosphoribosyl)-5-((5-phosphoribosylamino)methylideneamino)imidazole-4-carboxamide isomerase, partial [Sphingomonadales bacterium]|nr:1-(5-phosphoribosyl)-5-((5-phosphoribosylamino)methylideneamino)imidazole-4-carboxamide isomerase [Sphingomonadales bacterium]
MIVYPAIDLIGGQCVRLEEGDFDRTTTYDATPIDVAHSYRDAGAAWMHVVDLDGAKAGRPAQTDVIASLAAVDGLSVQAGGGVRALDDVLALLEAGVSRVVVGSLCVKEPDLVKSWIASLGADKLTLALDVRSEGNDFKIATHGWQETSDVSLFDVVADFVTAGGQHFLVTDISRDGMLEGVNVDLMATLQSR